MRAVFIGASTLAVATARMLLKRGHEVVMIERRQERIEALAEEIDCGFIHGDGSRPSILRETDPKHTHVLYCLTNHDQENIIASLVGRSLGFERVVTRIEDESFEHICLELGLKDTIIPGRTIGRYLADMFEGRDPLEISTLVRHEARAFSFVARKEDAGPVAKLELPERSRVAIVYRGDKFLFPDESTEIQAGDEVVSLTHREHLDELGKRFKPAASS